MYFYQIDPPTSQNQQGDEYDHHVVWVRSPNPALQTLESALHQTGCIVLPIGLREDDAGIDFDLARDSLDSIVAYIAKLH